LQGRSSPLASSVSRLPPQEKLLQVQEAVKAELATLNQVGCRGCRHVVPQPVLQWAWPGCRLESAGSRRVMRCCCCCWSWRSRGAARR
jgi:hypothetical protein